MKYIKAVNLNPLAEEGKKSKAMKAAISGSNDLYGACSIETFSSANGLTYTHEDAQGFLDYPTSFVGCAGNFWFRDSGVKVWEYEETYDNWQDTYGMDSVMVFYHSGHGGMSGSGVFQIPLGGTWDSRDRAFSNNMAFANEELRYLFWSTCLSLRVSGSDNPVRTWWDPNKGGLRMLFGYETTSVDDPNYGKYFWEEWNKGKTFARAFLDASWRISHDQVPVVMAAGANATEAINRLNTERFFSRTPAAKGWYQWQWIGTLPARSFRAKANLPKGHNALILGDQMLNDERIVKVASDVGIAKKNAGTIFFDENGNRAVNSSNIKLVVNKEGALNIHFGKTNLYNKSLIKEDKAIKIAQRAVGDLELTKNIQLKLGNIRHCFTCGGSLRGSGKFEEPYVVETIVQFRQAYKGVESINSDHGLITVSVDNDGRITNLYNSCKEVLGEADKARAIIASPPDKKRSSDRSREAQFSAVVRRIINRSASENIKPSGRTRLLREVVGYDFSGNMGEIVHQKDVEVNLDKNFRKRYKIRIPVMG